MNEQQKLWCNKWISVFELDSWYSIYRIGKTNSGVAILPYRIKDGNLEILMRIENCLPHGGFVETTITGMIEEDENPLQTAIKELREETGYVAEDLTYLGWVYTSKASDYKQYMYSIDLTDEEPEEQIEGDGTIGEMGASTIWKQPIPEVFKSNAPLLHTMILKLLFTPNK